MVVPLSGWSMNFGTSFTCAEGMKDEANEVVEAIAKKIVQDMPYEARVDAVVKYFAHERKMLLKKSLARRVHLTRSMYMKGGSLVVQQQCSLLPANHIQMDRPGVEGPTSNGFGAACLDGWSGTPSRQPQPPRLRAEEE
uniref:Uncharacterized protein n=1 Tax=Aegilops tauschii subsp. strangulata TaxID=200361 RepID=A0A453CUX8_AEGTS